MKSILLFLFLSLNVFVIAIAQNVKLDPDFASGGVLITSVEVIDNPAGIANQSNGKIIVLQNSGSQFILTRFNYNGSLDENFGIGGSVYTDFEALGINFGSTMHKILIQSDDKIIVGGTAGLWDSGYPHGADFGMVRFNPDGDLDDSFGDNGKLLIEFSNDNDDLGTDVIHTKDGGYLLSGVYQVGFDSSFLSLTKIDNNGNLVNSFGDNGKVITRISDSYALTSMVLEQEDGKILSGGMLFDQNLFFYYLGVVRYDANGNIDPTYGKDGIAQTNYTDPLIFNYRPKLMLQSNDRLISAGLTFRAELDSALHPGIIALNNKGKLDNTFGEFGANLIKSEKIDTIFESQILFTPAVLQPDDKIIFAYKEKSFINLYRFNKDGSLDENFGNKGVFTFDFEFPIEKSDVGSLHWSAFDNKLLYSVILNGNGFTELGVARIDVNYTTTTNEINDNFVNLKLYPNPAHEVIDLSFNLEFKVNLSYSLTDLEGKTVYIKGLEEYNSGNNNIQILIKELPQGLYFLNLEIDGKTKSIKFIKE